jgi:hypothetical protein
MQMREKVLLEVIKADSFRRWIEQIVFTEVLLDLVYAKGHPLSHYNASQKGVLCYVAQSFKIKGSVCHISAPVHDEELFSEPIPH